MSKKSSFVVVALVLASLTSSVTAAEIGKGNILIEEWINTNQAVNADVTTLKNYAEYPDNPSKSYWLQKFDRPDGGEDYWGGRLRGYLYPPKTGDYTFWTASDDDSEIWLSTDDTAANAKMICNVEGWTDYQVYLGTAGAPGTTFKSAPIPLTAGKKYYIEGVFSDGTGGGHISLAWGGPGIGAGPVTVDGKYLSPFLRNPEPMLNAQSPSPADGAVGVTSPLLTWKAGVTAQWHDFYFGTDPNPPLIGRQIPAVYYHIAGLEAGKTYYWKVVEVEIDGVTVHEGPVWSFVAAPTTAFAPQPRNSDKWISVDTALNWTAGQGAIKHDLYFGTDQAAVANRDAGVFKGALMAATFSPGKLVEETKYYWLVDEYDMFGAKHEGQVWSFTTIGAPGGVKAEYFIGMTPSGTPALTRMETSIDFSWGDPGGPGDPIGVDGFSARWTADLEIAVADTYTFITSTDDGARLWLSDELIIDRWVDQATADVFSNPIALEPGVYSLRMEYYENGAGAVARLSWQTPTVPRAIIPAGPLQPPVRAKVVYPMHNAVDVRHDAILTWSAGEEAARHDVYFGQDAAAVADATTATADIYRGRQALDEMTFDPGTLEWNKTYYWRVDEVNDANPKSPWTGVVWTFTTADFLVVDDMETYTDDEGSRIYETWIDGYVDQSSGAVVGYMQAPFAERNIIHGGRQSMPMAFDNSKAPYFSEAVQEFSSAQDWTVNGVNDLVLYVRGYPAAAEVAVAETGGKMSLAGAGADIWGASDQFTYAYKTLNGDGTLVAQVVSIGPGSNTWAKGGVMIRDSLDGGSASAQMVLTANSDGTAGNGAAFQNRASTDLDMAANDATSNITSGSVIAPPYWVKIERMGDTFNGYLSSNGTNWTIIGSTIIVMEAPVHIGLCVTSHAAGEDRTFEFENIATTGNVSGAWQGMAISEPVHNSAQGLYVTVVDSAGKKATATNADAVMATDWTEVKVPLSSLAGVNLSKVEKLIVGVGDPANPAADGTGRIFVDDIRVIKP